MSFSFSKMSFTKPNEDGTTPAAAEPKVGGNKSKLNPILNAVTDNYADDTDLYKPQITREQRFQYFLDFEEIYKDRKQKREKDVKDLVVLKEIQYFPRAFVWVFALVRSNRWDHWYLDLMLIFFLLIVIFNDGWAELYAPFLVQMNSGNNLYMIPLVLMFLSQLLPLFGTVFYVHFCNDLVRLIASSNFQDWSFVSCLTAQYVEYFYYGGRNKRERAGKIRRGEFSRLHQIKLKIIEFLERCTKKGAKIQPAPVVSPKDDESDSSNDDEESHSSDETSEENNSKKKEKKIVTIKVEPIAESLVDLEAGGGGAAHSATADQSKKPDRPTSASKDRPQSAGKERPGSANKSRSDGPPSRPTSATLHNNQISTTTAEEKEENPADYMDWICVVCNTANHKIKHNATPQVDIYFGESGLLYKRMYANMVFHSTKPACKKCLTVCDYKPPSGTAHLFPHNPTPHIAFTGYPKKPLLLHGQKNDTYQRYKYRFISFLYGKKNDQSALPMLNDWRLKKYILNHYPKIPKYELKPEERYEVGEIVECRQQKSEYFRARVLVVHNNDTYDIRYDAGDECRFVLRKDIRLGTEKRSFAYRVEMAMVILVVSLPICFMMAVSQSNPGLIFLSMFLLSLGLFLIRIKTFIQYAVNYSDAGICVIFRLTMFFILPIFFFFLTSISGLATGSDPANWLTIAALAVLTKILSLPVLYVMRPTYAILGMIIFPQTCIGMILLATYANSNPQTRGMLLIPMVPFITTILTLKYLRSQLMNIWDTCFVIRPRIDDKKSNPSIIRSIIKKMETAWINFKANHM